MKYFFYVCLIVICFVHAPAVAKDDTVLISTSYKSLFSTPEQTGMLDRVVIEAFRRIGHHAQIVFTPNARSLVSVNEGELDGEINRIAGMENTYSNLVRVPEPNMQMHFVAFAKKDFPISDWESLRILKVGIVNGWKILERNTQGFPSVTHVMNEEQLFQMLEMDRLDVVLYSKLSGYEKLEAMGYDDIYHLEPPLSSRDMFMYLHKDHKDFVKPIAEALREMKRDGTYDRIIQETVPQVQ
ncbi:transporter substrate-binding domain-containing protein [Pseudodesulfovibrio sp.]|nr:transporter substrate-binding domain-containing protein [Pseudodesulfovibrio sp.]